jgi:hypothetical protein
LALNLFCTETAADQPAVRHFSPAETMASSES